MKDLHSHLLYGIDDGRDDLEESIKLLKEMEKSGVEELILTPHYIENSKYNCNNDDKVELFNKFQERVEEEGINVTLYLGNEVYITDKFIDLIKDNEIWTLNGSKYLLFELPLRSLYKHTLEVCNELIANGYVPILAHPERYPILQDHPDMVEEYLRSGILLQGNLTSLFGKYGKTAEKTLKLFLKNNWISFLGSDTHHSIGFNEKKLRKKLLRITKDEDYVEDLLNNNFDKVINNEDMNIIR